MWLPWVWLGCIGEYRLRPIRLGAIPPSPVGPEVRIAPQFFSLRGSGWYCPQSHRTQTVFPDTSSPDSRYSINASVVEWGSVRFSVKLLKVNFLVSTTFKTRLKKPFSLQGCANMTDITHSNAPQCTAMLWSNFYRFDPILTSLIQIWQVCSNLDMSDPIWTS